MNDNPENQSPTDETQGPNAPSHSVFARLEKLIRRYPIAVAFSSVGIGCAVGIVARGLLAPAPPLPPQTRALRLLEDIQSRLGDFAQPAYRRASHLAEDGAHAMKNGIRSAADSKIADRLKHLFS